MHMCSEDCDPKSPSNVFLHHTLCMICLFVYIETGPHLSSPRIEHTVLLGTCCQTRVLRFTRQLLHHLSFISGFNQVLCFVSLLINRYRSFQRNSQVSVFNKIKKTKEDRILVTLKMPIVLCTCYVCIVYIFQNFVHVDKLRLYKFTL